MGGVTARKCLYRPGGGAYLRGEWRNGGYSSGPVSSTRGLPLVRRCSFVDQRRREILVFEVDGRRYGLPASEVRELLRAVAIVPLPLAGPAVEGVVNLRGRVVPVFDLRVRLGLPARAVVPSD